IPKGLYMLIAESPGFFRTGETRTVPYNAIPVNVTSGRSEPITVRLTAYAVIAGKLTSSNGVPRAREFIEILEKYPAEPGGPQFLSTFRTPDGQYEIRNTAVRTDDRGEFRMARLTPGTYYVVANITVTGLREDGE